MLFERYPRGKGSLAAPQTREHQSTIQTRKYGNEQPVQVSHLDRLFPRDLPLSLGSVFFGG
jgi:hypothetical protein